MHSRQLALDLGETPAPAPLLWELVPAEHQLVAVAALARLIALAAVPAEASLMVPSTSTPSRDDSVTMFKCRGGRGPIDPTGRRSRGEPA